jgi:hypothetical protein
LFTIVGVGLILLAHPAFAQLATTKAKAPPDNTSGGDKSVTKAEADRIREGRRLQARSLLFSLSNEARGFRDQTLRARSLARIADALWGVAAEQGRALFREAWAAADKADQESHDLTKLRKEVLSLTARRDRLLAEELLEKLKVDSRESKAQPPGNNLPSESNLWTLPGVSEKRLGLAKDLLSTGDVGRALEFADPVLGGVTISTVEFLTQLREKDPAAADRRYAAMLANTGGNMQADANTVSLLSSYIFTPHLYVIFDAEGGASSSMMRTPFPPADVAPQLRLAFFQTAGGVFLRPQPPPEQDRSTSGIAGKYMALKRLMPLFERYAPPEFTQAMRGLFESLHAQSSGVRQGEGEWVQKGISPERPFTDQERSLLDDVEQAGTAGERDRIYFRLALLALGSDDMKARDYVSRIDETSFRKRAQAWVDWSLAVKAVEKKSSETALELARSGELNHIQRVWVLTRAAKLLAKTDNDKALSLLADARAEMRLIDRAELDRPRGLLAVANALRVVAPSRMWDAISDAVEAANSTEGFTGEDGALILSVNSKDLILKKTDAVPDFDIEGIFTEAAKTDFDRAVQLAGGFKGEAPHASAIIAISRSVLNEKPPIPKTRPSAPV